MKGQTIHTLRRMLLAVVVACGAGASIQAQAPPPAVSRPATTPEQQIFDRYIAWLSALPVGERTDLLNRYRQHLKAQGLADAEIDRQIQIVSDQERRAEADRWNRYFTEEKPRYNTMPNAFLVQIAESRTPGTALDVGMAVGRNALWLARQGWDVTGFDPADQAVEVARKTAATLGLPLKALVSTDEAFDFGENQWDLILLSYEGCGMAAPRVERALKPGGIVIVESFHEDAARDHRIGGSICRTGELPALFKNLRTLHYSEPVAMPDFGNERMRIVRFAAEKPRTAIATAAPQAPDHMEHRFTNADELAKSFDDPARDQWQSPRRVIDGLGLKSGMAVADIGAGTGYFSVRLARSSARPRVFAVDIEPEMVTYLTKRAADEKLHNIVPVLASASEPNLPSPVDVVLIVDTYHHIGDRVQYFRALQSKLKPGGRVAIIDFRVDAPMGPPREFRHTPEEYVAEMKAAGYRLAANHRYLKYQDFLVFEVAH